jgi:hypothetical protein
LQLVMLYAGWLQSMGKLFFISTDWTTGHNGPHENCKLIQTLLHGYAADGFEHWRWVNVQVNFATADRHGPAGKIDHNVGNEEIDCSICNGQLFTPW